MLLIPQSLWAIASNSKVFVALSIGLLIERNTSLSNGQLLDWDTKIVDILGDDWKLEDGYATDHLDVTDLLSMRSGLPSHDLWYQDVPPLDTIRAMRNLPFTAEIRQGFQYNNLHYVTLSHIVSVLSGRPFHVFVNENIFVPLEMRSTTYNSTAAGQTGRRTHGYYHTGLNLTECFANSTVDKPGESCRGKRRDLGWWIEGDSINNAGPGGVITSLWDISAWQAEYLRPTFTRLTPSLIRKVGQPIIPMGRPLQEAELSDPLYGMGQMTQTYRGERVVFHTGGLPGQISQIWNLPDRGLSIAVFTNDETFGSAFMNVAVRMITDEVLDLPRIDWRRRYWNALKSFHKSPATPKDGEGKPLQGDFEHKGYGRLNISRLHDGAILSILPEGISRKHASAANVSNHLFVDKLVFTPFEGNAYNWTAIKYDPPMLIGVGNAVATDKGLGMFGRFSIPGNVKLHGPSENPEDAEVWFERV